MTDLFELAHPKHASVWASYFGGGYCTSAFDRKEERSRLALTLFRSRRRNCCGLGTLFPL